MRLDFAGAAVLLGLSLAWPDRAIGQAADGHLVGIVLDQTGASVPGCTVEVENVATGVIWKRQTDALGAYRFNNLAVGGLLPEGHVRDRHSPESLDDSQCHP